MPDPKEVPYGDFLRALTLQEDRVSYNQVVSHYLQQKARRRARQMVSVRWTDVYRIMAPYTSVRLKEQLKAVLPLSAYLFLFQILILHQEVQGAMSIGLGMVFVLFGLMLFMEGLKIGLMPFGQKIGNSLPSKCSLSVVLSTAFLLGIGVTFAEPAIGALRAAALDVNPKQAPYLYLILNHYASTLVLIVGVGVGLAAVLGTLRFIYNWSLKPFIVIAVLSALGITIALGEISSLNSIIGLAWDCGAVTTGPVTVPLILALGIGVDAAVGSGEKYLSGFGIVTLASLFPVIGVGCLALALYQSYDLAEIQTLVAAQDIANSAHGIWGVSPWKEIFGAVRAIVPLVVFLYFVLQYMVKESFRDSGLVIYGIILAVVGMAMFNIGLSYGLVELGNQSGQAVPSAFASVDGIQESPFYSYGIGIAIALGFAWFLGFAATLAEPALNALGMTVENLTQGAFRKTLLMYAVSIGVAFGIAVGVGQLIFDWPLSSILVPGYLIVLIMTLFSTEEFTNVAWDSAGVTTGPVTVPLVLAMGLGFGKSVGVTDGFGVLCLASLFPVASVLVCGLYIQSRTYLVKKKRERAVSQSKVLLSGE